MMPDGARRLAALAMHVMALAVLALALFGVSWPDSRSRPRLLVLADRSDSMPAQATDAAVADVLRAAKARAMDVQVVDFAGNPRATPSTRGAMADLQTSATNIERALEAALAAHIAAPYVGVVVISDGYENAGHAARALRMARQAGLPIDWIALGRPMREAQIVEVLAPRRVMAGQAFDVTVHVASQTRERVRITATARDGSGRARSASAVSSGEGSVPLAFVADDTGPVIVDVALSNATSGDYIDGLRNAAAVDVVPRASILYLQGSDSNGRLARSLSSGGWAVELVPAARADGLTDQLQGYEVLVLDDVSIADAAAPFWDAVASAVRDRGLGLVVLGGERSYARGGYSGSALEAVLPVLSQPAPLDQPVSVAFVVDKSGSMGRGSEGVDRFALAQRAVVETARGLSSRDSLGLVVFDVAPRVLIPMGSASAGTIALQRDWQVSPGGGTRLSPAVDAAVDQLERVRGSRRILVVVTDGLLDKEPVTALRTRISDSRIDVIALAVGPDADAAALQQLIGPQGGLVVRVSQAAGLPLAMRSALERHRARVERGTIAVQQREPLPFAPGERDDWPNVSAYAVTRARPEASVALQSERGDPLLAVSTSGRGRVVAMTSGFGRWSAQWMRWTEWPRFAGGLIDWTSGATDTGVLGLDVTEVSGGIQVDADVRTPTDWGDADSITVTVSTPGRTPRLAHASLVAPGRVRAMLPDDGPGLYTVVMSTPAGTERALYLRRDRAENEGAGTSPTLDEWRRAGLITDWNAASLARRPPPASSRQRPDVRLLAIALALFLAGLGVERLHLPRRLATRVSSRATRHRVNA